MCECTDCGCEFERINRMGPAPRYCPHCKIKRISDGNKAWWKRNPGLSTQYSRDRQRRLADETVAQWEAEDAQRSV